MQMTAPCFCDSKWMDTSNTTLGCPPTVSRFLEHSHIKTGYRRTGSGDCLTFALSTWMVQEGFAENVQSEKSSDQVRKGRVARNNERCTT